jgi:putative copper export protein
MKRTALGIFDTLYLVALAVWLGGLATFGAVASPTLFDGAALSESQADALYGAMLRRFTPILEGCAILLIALQFLLRRRYDKNRGQFILDGVRQLSLFAAFLLAEVCFRNLLPNLNASRRLGELAHITRLQGTYAILAVVQVGLLVFIAGATAWLSLPFVAGRGRAAVNDSEAVPTRKKSQKRRT